jgi:hypothetical protein
LIFVKEVLKYGDKLLVHLRALEKDDMEYKARLLQLCEERSFMYTKVLESCVFIFFVLTCFHQNEFAAK